MVDGKVDSDDVDVEFVAVVDVIFVPPLCLDSSV